MNAHAEIKSEDVPFALKKVNAFAPAFAPTGQTTLVVLAGFTIAVRGAMFTFPDALAIPFDSENAEPGTDYVVIVDENGALVSVPHTDIRIARGVIVGGFHFAPGGNATGIAGGDEVPAINPFSCWDLNFRPTCPDARGMALIGGKFWCDIYLLGVPEGGDVPSSRLGAKIADGRSLTKLDYPCAQERLAEYDKQLLGAEEFFAATYGVTERSAGGADPDITKLDAPRTSRHGIMQATGNMWVWGTDGHPDDPRASVFGGSWVSGEYAGSRCANLGCWPDDSGGSIGARGRSDHLNLA